ncbi:MAG: tetratricopeptide repeat protein [Myxococcaceae bacterium]
MRSRLALVSVVVVAVSSCKEKDLLAEQRHALAEAQKTAATQALATGDLQRALFAAELAAQYEPLDPAYRDLALRVSLAHIAAQRPNLSLDQFARAAYQAEVLSARDPDAKHIYDTVIATDLFARGKPKDALERVTAVTVKKPDYAAAWVLKGELHQAAHELKEALAAFEAANGLDRKNRRVVANLGTLYAQTGDARAIDTLLVALELEDTAAVRLTLANVYLGLGRPLDALPHFAKAAQLEPRDGKYRVALGEAHLKLDQLDQALQSFRDASALNAEPWASRGVGAVALKKKDYPTAHLAFTRVLALNPDELSTLYFDAETLEALNKPAEAKPLYERFLQLAQSVPSEAPRVLLAKDRLARLSK